MAHLCELAHGGSMAQVSCRMAREATSPMVMRSPKWPTTSMAQSRKFKGRRPVSMVSRWHASVGAYMVSACALIAGRHGGECEKRRGGRGCGGGPAGEAEVEELAHRPR